MDQIEFEKELKRECLLEASEMLEETESLFLKLEKSPKDEDLLNKIFRLAHTIKGSGYAAGFNRLAEFAHVFETLLAKLRTGEKTLNKDMMNTILKANDTLNQFVEGLKEDIDFEMDTNEVEKEIEGHLSAPNNAASEPQKELTPKVLPPSGTPKREPMDFAALNQKVKNFEETMKSATILTLDDEPAILELLEIQLSSFGHKTVAFSDGVEALLYLESNKVDLIISDIKMPGMDGITFLKEVNKRDKGNTPLMFISGAANRLDVVHALNAGAYNLLLKPFNESILISYVTNALRHKATMDAMVELSVLNFKAYLLANRIIKVCSASEEADATIKDLEQILNVISTLTNHMLAKEERVEDDEVA